MKTVKIMPLLVASLLVVLLASCGPAYYGYGSGPYYGYSYGYSYPYGYYRPPVMINRPPVVNRQRYYAPSSRQRSYNSPNARSGYSGNSYGGNRSRGPR